MKSFGDHSIDLTVTSPPYDQLRNYAGTLVWNDSVWKEVIQELYRVTKDGGVLVWVVSDATIDGAESGSSFKQALYAMQCGFNLHDTMIWLKDGGGAIGSNKTYTQNFEYMFVFSKGRPKTINLIRDKPNLSYGSDKSGVGRVNPSGVHKIEKRKPSKEYSRRNNWWYIPPQIGFGHPAVFPEQLAADHIRTWSNEGDVIFDPFAGSGTTGKVALELRRKFVGCEVVKDYFDVSMKRISAAVETISLFDL